MMSSGWEAIQTKRCIPAPSVHASPWKHWLAFSRGELVVVIRGSRTDFNTSCVFDGAWEHTTQTVYLKGCVRIICVRRMTFPPQNRCIDGCLACSSNTPIVGKKCQLLLRDKALIIQVSMWHQEDKNRPQNTHCTSPHLCIFLSWSTEGPHYFPPFLLISRQNSKANCPTDTDVERCCRCREKKKAPEQLRETS
jgi:hypothetical protein